MGVSGGDTTPAMGRTRTKKLRENEMQLNINYCDKGLVHKSLDLEKLLASAISDAYYEFCTVGDGCIMTPVGKERDERMKELTNKLKYPNIYSKTICVNSKNLEYSENVFLRGHIDNLEKDLSDGVYRGHGLEQYQFVQPETIDSFKKGFFDVCSMVDFSITLQVYRVGDKSYYVISRQAFRNEENGSISVSPDINMSCEG